MATILGSLAILVGGTLAMAAPFILYFAGLV